MARFNVLLLLLGVLASFASAAAPTFCKCTCFKNSTLIQLSGDGQSTSSSSSDNSTPTSLRRTSIPLLDTFPFFSDPSSVEARAATTPCSQCTRSWCLAQDLDICKGADEKTDAFATCFQRDSRKDEIIVWAFILATGGLLGWAAGKRVMRFREERGGKLMGGMGGMGGGGNGGGGGGSADRGGYAQVPAGGR